MNKEWHSRLPDLPFDTVNMKHGRAFGAIHGGIYYAIAIWSTPVAIKLDDGTTVELRRMAIADDAPKNTASRMLGWMIREMKKTHYEKAISYQDPDVHKGTIYKASGWHPAGNKPYRSRWNNAPNGGTFGKRMAKTSKPVSLTPKIRWEISLQNTPAQ